MLYVKDEDGPHGGVRCAAAENANVYSNSPDDCHFE